ncbi:MAG TPA: hypothetical protein VFS58_11855, partial [Steroidobacteraceae bacterium]|nr:hypothetical protein [Steroidobacteraceae bacterium]
MMWLKRNWPRTEGLVVALTLMGAGTLATVGVLGLSALWFAAIVMGLSVFILLIWASMRRLP